MKYTNSQTHADKLTDKHAQRNAAKPQAQEKTSGAEETPNTEFSFIIVITIYLYI